MTAITHEIALQNFHEQISYVLNHYQSHGLKASEFGNVVIGGLGGSGIGGRIARLAYYTAFPIPIDVISEYKLPAYVNEKSLVILSSYSGNTEETLSLYADAKSRNCTIIVLTGGGMLKQLATENGNRVYLAESGYQPRMALGYSLTTLLLLLGEMMGADMRPALEKAKERLQSDNSIKIRGEEMFHYFHETAAHKFVVVCDLAFEAIAIRFCQQIQENAKGEAFICVLPEGNHNVIESYYSRHDTNFILLNSRLNDRNTLRFQYLRSVIEPYGNRIFEFPVNQFDISAIFEVIHAMDWLSIFISNAKGVNNMEVNNIAGLKAYLEAHPS